MEVYPVHLLDNAENYRKAFVAYLLVFNDALDAQKLADSLSELLQIGDWKKLAGRLHVNGGKQKQGYLELHVPQQFTTAEPAIGFSNTVFDCNAEQHHLGRLLAPFSADDTVQSLSPDLMAFTGVPHIPRSMQELMERGGGPQLYLHVTNFSDATVVSLTWPHYLMDAMGLEALLRNWSLMVNDEAERVTPLLGAHTDTLREAVDMDPGPKEELILEKLSMGFFALLRLGFQFLCASLCGRKWEERRIALSPAKVDQLCRRARGELSANKNANAFISEGDILAAWTAQMLARSQANAPITVTTIVNARFKLNSLKEQTDGCYVQNLLMIAFTCFAAGCDREPLGSAALSYRQQLAEQCTQPQMLSHFRMQLAHVAAKGKQRMLFGASGSSILAVNNLAKIDTFRDVNFAGAVVCRGASECGKGATESDRLNPPGTIIYYHPMSVHRESSNISFFRILGRDHRGRLLLEGSFRPETWEQIVEDLAGQQDESMLPLK
ncbi:hypothetical protein NLG97_g9379 [Lecanicillium saksenae]|uniref:Uncharacterized protein n=1 Tax=Lecanicillium saksenae TaxID=468837 RepID=A0ACC1QIX8_9HYPO|nr:hypothetical protein NLG97_g9379 [Lecanicillium saksenae]